MKVIKVLVDKLPEGCPNCMFSVGSFYCRFLTPREGVPTGKDERHHNCPLALEEKEKENNDKD